MFSIQIPNQPENAALRNATPTAKLVGIPSVKGPNGDSGRQESAPGYSNIHTYYRTGRIPIVLVKFLNWCADDGENGGMYLCCRC